MTPLVVAPAPVAPPASAPSVVPATSVGHDDKANIIPQRDGSGVTQLPEIVVTASGLSGLWGLTAPSSIDIDLGLLSGVRIRYSGDVFDRDICRLSQQQDHLRATCIAGFTPTASGSVDDVGISLKWWSGPGTVIFGGPWDGGDVIDGRLSGGIAGMSVTGDIPATLHKLTPMSGMPVSAGLMDQVFTDLRRGSLSAERYEPAAEKRLRPAFSWRGAKEEGHSLIYLGQIHIRWHRWQAETIQDVYDVQSPSDRSLCRIAVSEHNRVLDFACQSSTD